MSAERPYFHENSPIVAVAVVLGREYATVDFDYREFDKEADRQNFSVAARSELTVGMGLSAFVNSSVEVPANLQGFYYSSFIGLEATDKMQSVFVHELSHAVDDSEGIPAVDRRYRLGAKSTKAFHLSTMALGVVVAPTGLLEVAGETLHPLTYLSESLFAAVVLSGLTVFYGYAFHPAERRARSAARKTNSQIFRIEKRATKPISA